MSNNKRQQGRQVGPYQLGPRYKHTGGLGRLYRARHAETRAPALVLEPTARQAEDAPLAEWQVRLTSSVAPAYFALEVERPPTLAHPVDASEELSFMIEDAERVLQAAMMRPGTLEFLSTPPPRPRERVLRTQSWRRIALAAGIGTVVAAASLALTHRASPGVQVVADADAGTAGAGWGGSGNVAENVVLTSATDTEPIVLARPMPKRPFDNQKRPPCKKPVEVEAFGGCWVPHKIQAPCPDELYEREGQCYLPAAKPQATPAAVSLQPLAVQSE